MPSPDKNRPSGGLGRLLAAVRPSRAGPLPVQTGFPTSLADLVVKNHGRLKKQPSPSSKRRKGGASASPSPSPSPSPPPSSPPPPPPPPAAEVSPSDRSRPDLSPSQAVRRKKSGAFGLGLGFLAVSGMVSLALLVIWSKKVVAGVTVASFSLFLLESLRSSSLRRRRQRPRPEAAESQLYLDGLGRVSPIREVEAETEPSRPSCSDSDRGIEASILGNEERSGVLDESSNPKAKTKKRSWKKLIASAKKLHKGRKNKEADCSGSFRSEGDHADAMSVGSFRDHADAAARGNVTATDSSGSRHGVASQTDVMADGIANEPGSLGSLSGRSSEIHVSPMEDDAPADLTKEEEAEEQGEAGIGFPALFLVAVVLVGLVVGKLPAVVFTMLCAVFFSSVRRLPCRGGGSRWRRLELPVS